MYIEYKQLFAYSVSYNISSLKRKKTEKLIESFRTRVILILTQTDSISLFYWEIPPPFIFFQLFLRVIQKAAKLEEGILGAGILELGGDTRGGYT